MVKILPILILLFTFYFLVPDTKATGECLIPTIDPNIEGGLISAPSISGFSTGGGVCNQDPSSAFASYAFENKFNYLALKSLYYTQAKQISSVTKHSPLIGDKTQADIPMTAGTDHLYYIQKTSPFSTDGNLNLSANMSGSTSIVFVDGNLIINTNYCYSTTCPLGVGVVNPLTGIVFIVQGDVYIDPAVNRIDAIIISAGKIYTAATYPSTCDHNLPVSTNQLVINGSLISIYKDSKQVPICSPTPYPAGCPMIEFCRTLSAGNTAPSELINHQVKYLVLLRNILSDTLQRWSEIQ